MKDRIDSKALNISVGLRTSNNSARRQRSLDSDELHFFSMSPFKRDARAIMESKAFRRLAFKTQVVTNSWNGLVRNRNSHTMEVVSIATQIAEILGLNVDLAEAIALGHDIGHTPFGHAGERFLNRKLVEEGRKRGESEGEQFFAHNIFSVIVAQKIERRGHGLNLCHQTFKGMEQHSSGSGKVALKEDMSEEGAIAMYADKFGYITADYGDMCRLGLTDRFFKTDICDVREEMQKLGKNQRERVSYLIASLCNETADSRRGGVVFEHSPSAKHFNMIKKAMYQLYPKINSDGSQIEEALDRIYEFVGKSLDVHPAVFIAMMTDGEVSMLANKKLWDITDLQRTSVWEQLDFLLNINPCQLDLNW